MKIIKVEYKYESENGDLYCEVEYQKSTLFSKVIKTELFLLRSFNDGSYYCSAIGCYSGESVFGSLTNLMILSKKVKTVYV
jgi:hypothetical protein